MKKAVLGLVVVLFVCTLAVSAQPVGKKFELGLGWSFSSYKWSDAPESDYVINIPLRFGYYIWKGLEIEPELMLTKIKHVDLGYNLVANVSYNFNLKGNLRPFVLAGVGFGNGYGIASIAEGDSSVDATLVNLGAGVKYLLGNVAALRAEYRYTHNHMKQDMEELYGITAEQAGSSITENLNEHQFLVGISIFF
mgnify:CR=1 FL=1